MTQYQVIWDNGHACGALAQTFDDEKAATDYGEDWLREMCGIDSIDPDSEDNPYSFEVIEVEPSPTEDEKEEAWAAEEQSLDYFNRYIAGDR